MKFMVCYTGSRSSRSALQAAIQRAKAVQGKIYLVASIEEGSEEEQQNISQLESALKNAEEQVKSEGLECEHHLLVRGMTPEEDLVAFSKEEGIDEIVIGIRQRSKMGKLVFGSTAQHVILNADCPVLTVK